MKDLKLKQEVCIDDSFVGKGIFLTSKGILKKLKMENMKKYFYLFLLSIFLTLLPFPGCRPLRIIVLL